MSEERYKSFSEFWPFYVAEHSRPATRWLHLIGTTAGIALLVYLIASGRWWLFPAWLYSGLRLRLARAFSDREEQAGDVQISALVVHGRLQDDRVDANEAKVLMRGNIPIPEIPHGEDLWLMVLVTSVRERRTQQGRLFCDASARNATGTIALKIWGEILETQKEIKPGLWGITGKLETFQDRSQFVVAEYRPITLEQYREHQNADPHLPRAYTFDIETLTLPEFRERVGPQLERLMRLGNMRVEQQQRYLEDIAAEEERCYALGSLSATSGRVLSIALHVGPIPGLEFPGLGPEVERARLRDRQRRLRAGRKESATGVRQLHEGLRSPIATNSSVTTSSVSICHSFFSAAWRTRIQGAGPS